jgi:2-polyprenyl-3-methyl-5-hydroxy-6-metoxy-1,4-benzoquinol methylase
MNYRQRMYDSYVSGNKQFLKATIANPDRQDVRNIANLSYAMKGWLSQVSKSGQVSDIACGEGNILRLLQSEGFKDLHGIDISPEQVELAQSQFPQVVCGDAIEYLNNHTNQFDLITAFDILEHFYKDEAIDFLDKIHTALRPGGRLILQLPNGDSPFAGSVVHGDFTHEVTYTTVSLKHVLLACGFENIEFQEHSPQPTSIKSVIRSAIWASVRQIIRFVHIVETGGPSTGVYARVMRATAVKKS